jgi:hypothetical protein
MVGCSPFILSFQPLRTGASLSIPHASSIDNALRKFPSAGRVREVPEERSPLARCLRLPHDETVRSGGSTIGMGTKRSEERRGWGGPHAGDRAFHPGEAKEIFP